MGSRPSRGQRRRTGTTAVLLLLATLAAAPSPAAHELAPPAGEARLPLPLGEGGGEGQRPGASASQELPPARWRGGVLFDDPVRAALRLSSDSARTRASAASDTLLRTLMVLPLLLDLLLAATALRRRPLLAAQLLVCSAMALALSGYVQGWVSRSVGRERPYVQECRAPVQPVECARSVASGQVSFYSGHTAATATGASLVWLHTAFVPRRWKRQGAVLRAAAALGALTTGLLRILADRHYATDVLGGLVGGVAFTLLAAWVLRLLPPSRVPEEATPAGGAPLDANLRP